MNSRKKIIFVLSQDLMVRNFIDSGATDDLKRNYDVIFACSDLVIKRPSGCVVINFFNTQKPVLRTIDIYLWYLSYFKYLKNIGVLQREGMAWNFKASLISGWKKRFLVFLTLPLIYELTMWFFGEIVVGHNREVRRCLETVRPAAIVAPGMTFDSFGMEFVNMADRMGIRTILPVAHWDYLSIKGMLRIKPDHVCVWGEQTKSLAVDVHGLPGSSVSVIGAPQFQGYFDMRQRPDISSRNRKGRGAEKLKLLFAGASLPYDEITLLQMLEKSIGTTLPGNVEVIYRPHPRQTPRDCEYMFNQAEFKNIRMDSERAGRTGKKDITPLEYYSALLDDTDGMITPFSTMLIEAALFGRPSLVIGFSDTVHRWKFGNVVDRGHLKILRDFKWIVFSLKRDEFVRDVGKLLEIINNRSITDSIKGDANRIVYSDNRSYAERLSGIVRSAVGQDG